MNYYYAHFADSPNRPRYPKILFILVVAVSFGACKEDDRSHVTGPGETIVQRADQSLDSVLEPEEIFRRFLSTGFAGDVQSLKFAIHAMERRSGRSIPELLTAQWNELDQGKIGKPQLLGVVSVLEGRPKDQVEIVVEHSEGRDRSELISAIVASSESDQLVAVLEAVYEQLPLGSLRCAHFGKLARALWVEGRPDEALLRIEGSPLPEEQDRALDTLIAAVLDDPATPSRNSHEALEELYLMGVRFLGSEDPSVKQLARLRDTN